MKRVLVLSMCVLLCGASSALATQYEAGWLTDVQGDVVTVNYQKSTYSSHVDEIDFTIASITGGANYIDTVAGGGTYGSAFGGLFSTAGSGYIALSTSSSLWPDYAQTNIGANPTNFPQPGSWINLDGYQTAGNRSGSGSTISGVTSSGLNGIKGYTSFSGVWASTVADNPVYEYDEDNDQVYNDDNSPVILGYQPQLPGVGDILAKIYVTTGTNVTYNGLLGLDTLNSVGGSFESIPYVGPPPPPVPEPSTLALLVSGMIGLLAYAWKKRK